MKRTKIQKIIIPRNWLFGRIAAILNNVRNLKRNSDHFTHQELQQLKEVETILSNLYKAKKVSSVILKIKIKDNDKS